jgi:hypothetical protein
MGKFRSSTSSKKSEREESDANRDRENFHDLNERAIRYTADRKVVIRQRARKNVSAESFEKVSFATNIC